MIGFIDVGGGMRDVYGAGVLDFCLDNGLDFSYFIGVSAGSANIANFLSRQNGRTLRFYRDYAMQKEYMSLSNFVKNGSYIDLNYVYTTLSCEDAPDYLDFDEIKRRNKPFYVVITNAQSGEAEYFDFSREVKNELNSLKASCCIPIVCKPYQLGGVPYVDGGLSDPIPIRRAFADGCDRVVLLLTRPTNYRKRHRVRPELYRLAMKKLPAVGSLLDTSIDRYNEDLEYALKLQRQGRVLILAPDDCCGVETLSRSRENIVALYNKGYKDGEKIKFFLESAENAV